MKIHIMRGLTHFMKSALFPDNVLIPENDSKVNKGKAKSLAIYT